MQWRKFYGRTMSGAMARVRVELGADALILESREIEPGSAAARMNPGARFEIIAVRERKNEPKNELVSAKQTVASHANRGLLEDLGLLRSQVNELLGQDGKGHSAGSIDMSDYHELIGRGVDHKVLAQPFRQWLDWRLAPAPLRKYLAAQGGPAQAMEGDSLREWLWHMMIAECGLRSVEITETPNPRITALLGPTGSGKTTTLAKIASIKRQKNSQKIVIATLDACRFGAIEQWRRVGKLIGVEVQEIASEADATRCMETWDSFDWVGIDTPGSMSPESAVGRLYGSILANCPHIESTVVVPMTQTESISRRNLERGRGMGARRLLFSKLDETEQTGSILNLTMNQQWKINGFATGTRVPEDWENATAESLWRRALAPAGGVC